MVKLENKKVQLSVYNPDDLSSPIIFNDTYSNLVLKCCTSSESKSFNWDQIKKITRIDNSIKKEESGFVNLEDADFEFVKQSVNKMTWNVPSPQLIDFLEYINSLK